MKLIILIIFYLPASCLGQKVEIIRDSLGIHNDTLYFKSYKGINYDTSYVGLDYNMPSRLEKLERMKRFKVDSLLIREIEQKMYSSFLDSCKNLFVEFNNSIYNFSKNDIDTMKKEFKKRYSDYNRRYFGYFDSNGYKNVIIKFIWKQDPDFSKIAATTNLTFRSLGIVNYNLHDKCFCRL